MNGTPGQWRGAWREAALQMLLAGVPLFVFWNEKAQQYLTYDATGPHSHLRTIPHHPPGISVAVRIPVVGGPDAHERPVIYFTE